MKKQLLFISLFLFSFSVLAQTKNVDVRNFRFTSAYRETPQKPLNPMAFYYSVAVKATKNTEQRIDLDEVRNAVAVQGQRNAEGTDINPEVRIELDLGNLIIKKSAVSERVSEHKDKEGRVSRDYYYTMVIEYAFTSSFKIMQGENVLDQVQVNNNTTYSHRSQEYGSRKEANDYWNNNRDVLTNQFTRDLSIGTAQRASGRASSLYGFPALTGVKDVLQITSEKKHLENTPFREATEALKVELEKMTPEVGLDKEAVKDLIAYYEAIPKKYTDPKRKADSRLRYAAYFNLGQIYYYLDDPEMSAVYADLLIANGYFEKDGRKMNTRAQELREVITRTPIKTRHFNPDDFFGSEAVAETEIPSASETEE